MKYVGLSQNALTQNVIMAIMIDIYTCIPAHEHLENVGDAEVAPVQCSPSRAGLIQEAYMIASAR